MNVGLSSAQLRGIVAVIEARVDKKQGSNAARVLDEALRSRSAAQDAQRVANQKATQSNSPRTRVAANEVATPLEVLRADSQPSQQASLENFRGNVTIEARFQREAPSRVGGATVTFQANARTAWHEHPLGQTLIVTSGIGWVQRQGATKQTIRPGDVVWIPPGVRHWHGATTSSAMTHVAIAESLDGRAVTWHEPVSDEQYRGSDRTAMKLDGRID